MKPESNGAATEHRPADGRKLSAVPPALNRSSSDGQSSLRRNVSKGNLIADRVESKVLVIYTGGTIGMIRNETGGMCVCTVSEKTSGCACSHVCFCMYLHGCEIVAR